MTGPAPDPAAPATDPTTNPTRDQVPARPAATVVILRDGGEGIEAFMVVRHHAIDFAAGALVFPGGKVDPDDADEGWGVLAPVSATPPMRPGYVAAARESFEEAGLMLARRQGAQSLLSAVETHELVDRHRANLIAGKICFLDIVRREQLTLATDLLVPFAHWITPEGVPKRFDTHFLLVAAPVNQLGAHDGSESIEGLWIRPQLALAAAEAGARTLVFATQMNLTKLARHATVADAIAAARASPVVTVTPQVERLSGGRRRLRIPAEAGYGVSEIVVTAPPAMPSG
jgi:8-oxo-dGTP pyrophosphatase MutT (NUDIX family)